MSRDQNGERWLAEIITWLTLTNHIIDHDIVITRSYRNRKYMITRSDRNWKYLRSCVHWSRDHHIDHEIITLITRSWSDRNRNRKYVITRSKLKMNDHEIILITRSSLRHRCYVTSHSNHVTSYIATTWRSKHVTSSLATTWRHIATTWRHNYDVTKFRACALPGPLVPTYTTCMHI